MTFCATIRLSSVAGALAFAVAAFAFAPHAHAQGDTGSAPDTTKAPGVGQVFATVNGVPITAGDILTAAEDYARRVGGPPGSVPPSEFLNVLIDLNLVTQAAEAKGLENDDAIKRRLAFDRMRTLYSAYLSDLAQNAVTDEAVKARYDEETAKFEPQDELHLRHILVATEDEGKQIIAEIKAGGDFAEIAKEKSTDPGSAANGGDLDFVGRGVTVPEFENAAFALDVGEMTDAPVKTNFGWHVIKVEGKRKSSPPDFDTEEPRIRNELRNAFFTDTIAKLRAAADIQFVELPAAAEGDATPGDGATTVPAEEPAQ